MGQLKNAITALSNQVDGLASQVAKADAALQHERQTCAKLFETGQAGWEMVGAYLAVKFQKQGATIAAEKDKTLQQIIDPGLGKLVKGVDEFRKALAGAAARRDALASEVRLSAARNVELAEAEPKKVRAIADKKKAKRFLSNNKAKAKATLTQSMTYIKPSPPKKGCGQGFEVEVHPEIHPRANGDIGCHDR